MKIDEGQAGEEARAERAWENALREGRCSAVGPREISVIFEPV
jgi:hypothetical protein